MGTVCIVQQVIRRRVVFRLSFLSGFLYWFHYSPKRLNIVLEAVLCLLNKNLMKQHLGSTQLNNWSFVRVLCEGGQWASGSDNKVNLYDHILTRFCSRKVIWRKVIGSQVAWNLIWHRKKKGRYNKKHSLERHKTSSCDVRIANMFYPKPMNLFFLPPNKAFKHFINSLAPSS